MIAASTLLYSVVRLGSFPLVFAVTQHGAAPARGACYSNGRQAARRAPELPGVTEREKDDRKEKRKSSPK